MCDYNKIFCIKLECYRLAPQVLQNSGVGAVKAVAEIAEAGNDVFIGVQQFVEDA